MKLITINLHNYHLNKLENNIKKFLKHSIFMQKNKQKGA